MRNVYAQCAFSPCGLELMCLHICIVNTLQLHICNHKVIAQAVLPILTYFNAGKLCE